MIKITFEISEGFIMEQADLDNFSARMRESEPILALKDALCFTAIKNAIKSGATEFCVTPDKLDKKSMEMYNQVIGEICALAAFSETDNKKE